jgi:hypothetical protein
VRFQLKKKGNGVVVDILWSLFGGMHREIVS